MSLNQLIRGCGGQNADPLFDKVALLMHMDGEDGSSVFPDVCGGVTTPSNVVVRTDVKHSGSGSAYFNHASANILIANTEVPVIGTRAFSIEVTFWLTSVNNSAGLLTCASATIYAHEWAFYLEAGYLKFYYGRYGFYQVILGVPISLVVGQKYRVSVERDDLSVWRFYINGVPYNPVILIAQNIGFDPRVNIWADTPLRIGCRTPGIWTFYGYIDELRVTIGEARGKGAIMVDDGLPFPDK